MSSLKLRLLIAAIAITMSVKGQTNDHGLYVNGTSTWLGDTARENQVLRYAQQFNFNYLTLYDLNLSWTPQQKNQLGAFIRKAKTTYGISKVGAAGETYWFFQNRIVSYNTSRTLATEKFDILNYEFEFWLQSSINSYYAISYLAPNGFTADTAGAFAFAWIEFQRIDALCSANGLISEIYLGWPNRGQMQKIASIADRILLHAYRTTDVDVYQYTRTRLDDISSLRTTTTVLPIFSSEPVFMKNWLMSNPISKPYQTYSANFQSDSGAIKSYINLKGDHWFVYTTMPNIAAQASISVNGPLEFCEGGSVVLTANQGTSYLWSPGGATTRSITATTSGTYSVQVIDAYGITTTSSPVTVTTSPNAITPVITVTGSNIVCQGGYVIFTSSPANSYLWSNGATTQSITVSQAGNYSVSTTTTGCRATSAPIPVQIVEPPSAPVITSGGSLNVCPGSPVTLTAPTSGGYLWSNGATTRSIVVNATGSYSVRVYNAPYCFNISVPANVIQLPAPPTPVVTVSGPTTLNSQRPVTTLVSSSANSYAWSGGQTTQSINVNTQGSYRVTITGANGCKSTSAPVSISANGCTPPAVPVITATGTTNLMPGQTVTLFSSLAPGYLWSNGATTRTITVSAAGDYSVRTYNGSSCFATSLPITVRIIPARIKNSEITLEEKPLRIFPNPASEQVSFLFTTTDNCKSELRVINPEGRIVLRKEFETLPGDNEISIDVTSLAPGLYHAQLISAGKLQSQEIIIAR